MQNGSDIKDDYAASLEDLTFNSKPLINTLTMIAHENIQAASVIVEVIEKRILTANPRYKLPVLYLMDSILKNVGSVYKELFERIMIKIFKQIYGLVDEKAQQNMTRIIPTWANIFKRETLDQLEAAVSGRSSNKPVRSAYQPKMSTMPPAPVYPNYQAPGFSSQPLFSSPMPGYSFPPAFSPEQTHLISLLQNAIMQRQTFLSGRPQDLQLLMPQIENLQKILNYAMAHPLAMPQIQQYMMLINTPWMPTAMPSYSAMNELNLLNNFLLKPTTQPATTKIETNNNISSSSSSSSINDSSTKKPEEGPVNLLFSLSNDSLNKYSFIIDFVRRHPGAVQSLYDDLSLQCKQCGWRFPKTEQDKMQSHMDQHFRQNKKQAGLQKKSISRDWFLLSKDWIESKEVDTTSTQQPHFEQAVTEDKGQNGIVEQSSIPLDEQQKQCQICHEKFEVFWDEDAEEWMMKDAMKYDDHVYHVLCFKENKSQRKRRLTEEDSVGSSDQKKQKEEE